MKEHPILYSTPMIQAKLEGRKTQTRRIIKESFNGCLTNGGPHPCPNDPVVLIPGTNLGKFLPEDEQETVIDYPQVRAIFHCSTLDSEARCPFGKVGDILWARETWAYSYHWEVYQTCVDNGPYDYKNHPVFIYKADHHEWKGWKPSIHMPKEAARIWERITDIRVERLQDITEADAIAEGIQPLLASGAQLATHGRLYKHYTEHQEGLFGTGLKPIASYKTLWESINGEGSWDLSPWVWVVVSEVLSTTGRPKELDKDHCN